MRALTVLQPWASLIANGEKLIETRPHACPSITGSGELLAIHAGKRWGPEQRAKLIEARRLCPEAPAHRGLLLGCVVAVVAVLDCVRMTPEWIAEQDETERALGYYEPGRFGWVLGRLERLEVPVPARGHQGIWRLQDDVEAKVLEQLPAGAA